MYSLIYNGSYMLIDMVLILIVGAIMVRPLGNYMKPAK